MSLDAIKQVSAAEEEAEKKRLDAQLDAKKILAAAEEKGKEAVKTAISEAENEIVKIYKAVDERNVQVALKIADQSRSECDALEKTGSIHMEDAISIIIGRIVNG